MFFYFLSSVPFILQNILSVFILIKLLEWKKMGMKKSSFWKIEKKKEAEDKNGELLVYRKLCVIWKILRIEKTGLGG